MALEFPNIDPVLLDLGEIKIRYYGLAYVISIMLAYFYCIYLARITKSKVTPKILDDSIMYLIVGMIVGARLGYVLFYNLNYHLENPLTIFMTWKGGLSFHGGVVGVIIAMIVFTKTRRIKFFDIIDLYAAALPIGIFLGRIANFINGELYGKYSNAPWAVKFPLGGYIPRHPSQIYESFFEGLVLFFILFFLYKFTKIWKKRGNISGVFLILYGTIRIILENFREPDYQVGYIYKYITMGQILSLPMLIAGILILVCVNIHDKHRSTS